MNDWTDAIADLPRRLSQLDNAMNAKKYDEGVIIALGIAKSMMDLIGWVMSKEKK